MRAQLKEDYEMEMQGASVLGEDIARKQLSKRDREEMLFEAEREGRAKELDAMESGDWACILAMNPRKAEMFIKIIHCMSDLITDSNIDLTSRGLSVQAMDSAHVSLIILVLL